MAYERPERSGGLREQEYSAGKGVTLAIRKVPDFNTVVGACLAQELMQARELNPRLKQLIKYATLVAPFKLSTIQIGYETRSRIHLRSWRNSCFQIVVFSLRLLLLDSF